MKSAVFSITTMIIVVFGLSGTVFSQGDQDCITAKCHPQIAEAEYVHGPVGAKICAVCHRAVEGKKHQFTLAAEKDELCFGCHEESRDMMLEDHLHTPVENGNCVGCHEPHGSDYRFSLKGNAADLCYQCHDKQPFMKEFVHGPIGVGDCNVCHDPHASAYIEQLREPPEEICYTCHREQADIPSKRHIHPPVAESCTKCHSPHSNDAMFLLGVKQPDACYECHDNIADYASVEHPHDPVAAGECNKCHDVHASDNPRMFPQPQMDLCLSCHEDLKLAVEENEHKHGPIKDGDCNACHDPHGSNFYRNLRNDFPEEFYMPYATENYAICFQCHNKDVALDAKTTTLTDFRDGDINMHYLHVNKEVKGRSCKACHEPHASSQGKHVRVSVPFGKMNWELPITYTKYEDGGKCVVGCHSPKEYRR